MNGMEIFARGPQISNLTLSGFPGKFLAVINIYFNFPCERLLTQCLNQMTDLVQIRYRILLQILYLKLFSRPILKLRVVHLRKYITQQYDTLGFYRKLPIKKQNILPILTTEKNVYCSNSITWIISCKMSKVTSKSFQWFLSYNRRKKN